MTPPLLPVFQALTLLSLILFAVQARAKFRILMKAQPLPRFDRVPERLQGVLFRMFGQRKLFFDPLPGVAHAFIFWGFCVVSIESLHFFLTAFGVLLPEEPWQKYFYPLYNVISFLVIAGVLYGLSRRLIFKTARLKLSFEGVLILLCILLLMVSGLLMSMPATFHVSESGFALAFWAHGLVFLFFLNFLPRSKHMHILTVLFNVFFRTLDPPGRFLTPVLENKERFGLGDFRDLTRKDVLDGYTCTECGRCTERCPAHNAGKNLDPREVILGLRDYVAKNQALAPENYPVIVGNALQKNDLFDCTTCHACQTACPVENEHLSKIMEMRRNRVLMEGDMPEAYQALFKNLENNANPWGMASSQRGDWPRELKLPLLSEKPDAEYLFFLGCAGSFDARARKITASVAKILNHAGVSYAVLGDAEFCCGDPARRAGNEYLFQEMVKANKGVIEANRIKKVITLDPHCFSTLKNEYPDFGITLEVWHHADFIRELISKGRLKLKTPTPLRITYHDSCYLGRYNNIYKEPRAVLAALGHTVVEMKNHGRKSLCCGAGGGRMWIEEEKEHRLNERRVTEALETNVELIVTACPFCMIMFEDGLKEKAGEKGTRVLDLAEVVDASLS